MAVKWYRNNALKKNNYLKIETSKQLVKSFLANEDLKLSQKVHIQEQFFKYDKYSSCSYYRRYSIINFNGRAVLQRFKLHRLVSKKWASLGYLIGLRKSSF